MHDTVLYPFMVTKCSNVCYRYNDGRNIAADSLQYIAEHMQPASVENAADFFKDSKLHLIFIELGTTHKSSVQTNGVWPIKRF